MAKKYSEEQLWKVYEKLPEELKEAIFSEETADNIHDICLRNDIKEENISEIAEYVGYVLLGVLTPSEFQETLERELKIEKDVAKKVVQEINRFIFYPVKPALEQLHKMEISPAEKTADKPMRERPEIEPTISEGEELPEKDIYREPIE